MRPGPPPKPTALKVLHGSKEGGLKRRASAEPRPRPLIPDMPDFLDRAAQAEWKRITVILHRLGLVTEADGAVLATYCTAFSMVRRCSRRLERLGLISISPSGYKQQRPEVSILRQQQEIMIRCAEQFGLTPSARARINGPGTGPAVAPRDLTMNGLLDYD